jgi:hypothetical protein
MSSFLVYEKYNLLFFITGVMTPSTPRSISLHPESGEGESGGDGSENARCGEGESGGDNGGESGGLQHRYSVDILVSVKSTT